jgi:hypothetical protein
MVDAMPAGVSNASRDVTITVFNPAPGVPGAGRARCGANSEAGGAGGVRLTTDKGEQNKLFPTSFATTSAYRLLLQTDGATANCVQIRGQESVGISNAVEGDQKGAVSFSLRSVFANYDYILVVKSPTGR